MKWPRIRLTRARVIPSALAETVRAAYAAVLGCPVDSVDADFFQLGGVTA